MRLNLTATLVLTMWQLGQPGSAAQTPRPEPVSVSTAAGDHVVLEIQVDDRAPRDVSSTRQ